MHRPATCAGAPSRLSACYKFRKSWESVRKTATRRQAHEHQLRLASTSTNIHFRVCHNSHRNSQPGHNLLTEDVRVAGGGHLTEVALLPIGTAATSGTDTQFPKLPRRSHRWPQRPSPQQTSCCLEPRQAYTCCCRNHGRLAVVDSTAGLPCTCTANLTAL